MQPNQEPLPVKPVVTEKLREVTGRSCKVSSSSHLHSHHLSSLGCIQKTPTLPLIQPGQDPQPLTSTLAEKQPRKLYAQQQSIIVQRNDQLWALHPTNLGYRRPSSHFQQTLLCTTTNQNRDALLKSLDLHRRALTSIEKPLERLSPEQHNNSKWTTSRSPPGRSPPLQNKSLLSKGHHCHFLQTQVKSRCSKPPPSPEKGDRSWPKNSSAETFQRCCFSLASPQTTEPLQNDSAVRRLTIWKVSHCRLHRSPKVVVEPLM